MRRVLSVAIVAALTASASGCQALMEFEAWKQHALFSCFFPNYCPPVAVDACAPVCPTPCAPACDPVLSTTQEPCCSPTLVAPGQAIPVVPGQTVPVVPGTVTPAPTLVPGPQTYAPAP